METNDCEESENNKEILKLIIARGDAINFLEHRNKKKVGTNTRNSETFKQRFNSRLGKDEFTNKLIE